jgi:hypothetical protein
VRARCEAEVEVVRGGGVPAEVVAVRVPRL